MSDGDQGFRHRSDAAVTVSSQLMIAAVIFLFMVVVFIFFLYLYAKHYMGSRRSLRGGSGRFIFAAADVVPVRRRGLDEEILNSLPVTPFKAADFKDGGLECSVCLSEVADGEKVLLLPKCGHGFHVGCIGTWFRSHSTCPLCRAAVEAPAPANDAGPGTEAPAFPTNVLFWGSQGGVGGGAAGEEDSGASAGPGRRPEGMLVIDIPRRPAEGFLPSPMSPLPTSRFATEEVKTPKSPAAAAAEENARTPMSARLKSLRRLLSRGKRVVGSSSSSPSSSSPRGGDIEQGGGGGAAVGGGAAGEGSSLAPKTPTS